MARTSNWLGLSEAIRQEFHLSLPSGCNGPRTCAIFQCHPMHIRRQLNWKQSSSGPFYYATTEGIINKCLSKKTSSLGGNWGHQDNKPCPHPHSLPINNRIHSTRCSVLGFSCVLSSPLTLRHPDHPTEPVTDTHGKNVACSWSHSSQG